MKLLRIIVASLFVFSASNAFALLDAELLVGKRWAEFDTSGTNAHRSGTETVIAAHINPIPLPLVSIGFGASVGLINWNTDNMAGDVTKALGMDVGLEAMVSVAIPFLAEPYAKLNYTVASTDATEFEVVTAAGTGKYVVAQSGSGTALSLGLKTSFIPLISILLEAKMYTGTLETDTYEVDGVSNAALEGVSTDVTSNSFLLGIEVGI